MLVYSSLKAINALIGGYYEKIPTAIFATPATGKTLLLLQEAHFISAQSNKPSLFIDTEGGAEVMYSHWRDKLTSRFGSAQILFRELTSVQDLLSYMGYSVKVSYSEGGQVEVKLTAVKEESDFARDASQSKLIVLDSFSSPLKRLLAFDRKNFPARAAVISLISTALCDCASKYSNVLLTSHHASRDPANVYARPDFYGGTALHYVFKIVLALRVVQNPKKPGLREVGLVRFFDRASWDSTARCEVTDEGFVDSQ